MNIDGHEYKQTKSRILRILVKDLKAHKLPPFSKYHKEKHKSWVLHGNIQLLQLRSWLKDLVQNSKKSRGYNSQKYCKYKNGHAECKNI